MADALLLSVQEGQGAKPDAKAAKDTKAAKKAPKAKGEAKKRDGMSGLDAAAKVLADAGKPMNCKEMVETMLAKGLWKTGGRTPAATIYAAIIREIAAKGKDARFRKTDRGQFEATAAARQ
jgi:restriction system protein